ncbi:MAG TPA: serine/threonine protein kinase, partial [Mycobacterium sp.]|nr:serine/threonine protein kinase [Mycobacterium sp.]
ASFVNRQNSTSSALVFDDIDGRWVAVAVRSGSCRRVDSDSWTVFVLQPRPDGTLSGEFIESSPQMCTTKQSVTFTRTRDVDATVQVADPEAQPARVVSAAQGLHGRYHYTENYPDGSSATRTRTAQRNSGRCGPYDS